MQNEKSAFADGVRMVRIEQRDSLALFTYWQEFENSCSAATLELADPEALCHCETTISVFARLETTTRSNAPIGDRGVSPSFDILRKVDEQLLVVVSPLLPSEEQKQNWY
jgi:hypothetical protein